MDFLKTVALFLFVHNVFLLANCELVDMSFPYENKMPTWPGMLAYNITLAFEGSFLKAPYVTFFNMELGEHTGTHIDAPSHFGNKRTVDKIALESLIGVAIVVDITEQAKKEPDYQLTVDDLKNWEKKHGRIPDGSILFLLTGWGKYWGDYDKYFGVNAAETNVTGNITFHWPGFHNLTAQWLVDNRKIKGIGTDARSFDRGSSEILPAHQIFLANNIYGLESVANIDKLPVKGATVYVMPMKIKGGSGGPTRIIAQTDPAGHSPRLTTTIGVVLMSTLLSMIMFI